MAATTNKNQHRQSPHLKRAKQQSNFMPKRKKKLKNPNLSFRLEAFSASDQTSGPINMAENSPAKTNGGLITLLKQDDGEEGEDNYDADDYENE